MSVVRLGRGTRVASMVAAFAATIGLVIDAPSAGAAPSPEAIDAITTRYAEFGGADSLLGVPTGLPVEVPGGVEQDYSGGAIFYSYETGARVMHGAILVKYLGLGGPGSALGLPTTDETDVGDEVGQFTDFTQAGGAAIYWSPDTGPRVLRAKVLEAWRTSGATSGPFGYPTSDTTDVGGVQRARFVGPQGTQISWSEAAGLVTVPPGLAASIPGFEPVAPPTEEATPAEPPEADNAAPIGDRPPGRSVAVGATLTALLVGLLMLRWRRRRAAQSRTPEPSPAVTPAAPPPEPDVPAAPEPVDPPPAELSAKASAPAAERAEPEPAAVPAPDGDGHAPEPEVDTAVGAEQQSCNDTSDAE